MFLLIVNAEKGLGLNLQMLGKKPNVKIVEINLQYPTQNK